MRDGDRRLHAYFDGELGRFARVRFEARLRNSPELRRQLEDLRALRALARESGPAGGSPDVWDAVSRRLASIDAQLRVERDARSERPFGVRWTWTPNALGTAAFAAAAVVAALVLSSGPGDQLGPPGAATAGVIRYLDTGERSVMLVEGRDDVTIIWLMDPAGGEA